MGGLFGEGEQMTDHIQALIAAADQLDQAHAARDQAVIDAHAAQVKPAHIAKAVRLSRTHVYRIINAERARGEDRNG